MEQMWPDGRFLQRLSSGLPFLEPFLSGSGALPGDFASLAAFVRCLIPLDRMALLCPEEDGREASVTQWGSEAADEEACRIRLLALLPELLSAADPDDPGEEWVLARILEEERAWPDAGSRTAAFPIRRQGRLRGFLVLTRQTGQAFQPEEIGLMRTAAELAGAMLTVRSTPEESRLQSWVFNEMMDSMNTNLYITDPKTDRILFMNKTMKRAFGLEAPEGKICWQALQKGMTERCAFCPVRQLFERREDEEFPACRWEEHNTLTGRTYENYDSLMRWTDGSLVHFQQSVDVTEDRRLRLQARLDDLTEMMNRRAGKEELARTLEEARQAGLPLTVCMYDVNELKEVNDTHGHVEGDRLLQQISRIVRETLGPQDYAFRLSGDEFVIVFQGILEDEAGRKIESIRERLSEEQHRQGTPYEVGFCCGILEVGPKDPISLPDLLVEVDARMYEQKRWFHIRRAEERLEAGNGVRAEGGTGFAYDKERLYDALVRSTDDYIYICDMRTNTFRYPPAMVEEFGLPGEVVPNAAAVWGSHVHEHDRAAFLESNQEIADGRTDSHCVEYRARNRRGEWVWLRCRGRLERDEQGEPRLFAGFITNLSKKNQIDHMTGLFNKYEFENAIRTRIQDQPESRLCVMLLGLDEFKHINDLYNREFGDEVIRIASQKVRSLLPSNAAVYRLDGDEFGIVIRGGGKEEMQSLFRSIQESFSRQQEYDGQKYFCTLSAGGTLYPEDGKTYLDLYKCADCALDYAKSRGKNRLEFFFRELRDRRARMLDMTERLRESIEHDFEGFELHYQIQVHADSGRLKGAEALARWHCDTYGAVPPAEFIPLLEESGLILPAGRWIFREAVAACVRWQRKAEDFTMSVNLSYLQLTDPSFIRFMQETMERAGVDPCHIIVELTESYIASSIRSLSRVFAKIRSLGLRIAMDDFGTGYSALEILKQSPADIVKIDRAFVKDIQNSHFDATFIRFIVELCHNVGIKVCLEGVETPEEYEAVRHMRLDYIQGYLFGRPVPGEEFDRLC